jgi:hypothetical protein
MQIQLALYHYISFILYKFRIPPFLGLGFHFVNWERRKAQGKGVLDIERFGIELAQKGVIRLIIM